MLCTALFYTADGLGRFDPSSLSEQALMELLVENVSQEAKQKFQTSSGSYKDIFEWPGVQLNLSGKVAKIRLQRAFTVGDLCFQYIPRHVILFSSTSSDWTGTVEFADLPPAIEELEIYDNRLHGTIDTTQLPGTMHTCNVRGNKLSGSINLKTLPEKMRDLLISQNQLVGTVDLTNFGFMIHLDLSENQLTGSLGLSKLPRCMEQLLLHDNNFSGEISFENIPASMNTLTLAENQLTGPIRFVNTSKMFKLLTLAKNHFSGDAVVSVQAGWVNLRDNSLSSVVDENGKQANSRYVKW